MKGAESKVHRAHAHESSGRERNADKVTKLTSYKATNIRVTYENCITRTPLVGTAYRCTADAVLDVAGQGEGAVCGGQAHVVVRVHVHRTRRGAAQHRRSARPRVWWSMTRQTSESRVTA